MANAPPLPPNTRLCSICRRVIGNNGWNQHCSGAPHRRKAQTASLRLSLKEARGSHTGAVTIEGNGDFGVISTGVAASAGKSQDFRVRSTASTLTLVSATCNLGRASPFLVEIAGNGREITTSRSIALKITFRQSPATIGRYETHLEVVLKKAGSNRPFVIVHPVQAIVGELQDHVTLAPTAPYTPRSRRSRQLETRVTAGAESPVTSVIKYKRPFPPSLIPEGLKSALTQGAIAQVLANVREKYLPRTFGIRSHGPYFKTLLWIEEAKAEEDMMMYDMENVRLDPHKSHHWLEVPGLAEKRPSVMLGDRILVRKRAGEAGHWYEGRVYDIQQIRIDIRLPKKAKITAADPCDVRFKLNRVPLQRQHQALLMTPPSRILFPKPSDILTPAVPTTLRTFFNPLVAANPRQKLAVESILSRPPGSPPFIVFGPPGTGKTVTIVESILQLLSKNPSARILACAPSNAAADIIAERLLELDEETLFRMYAPSRHKSDVPTKLIPYTFTHKDGPFSVPEPENLALFRVIVTTCVSASIPYGVGVSPGHFTHIFVDEAGHATEPEALVSIATMSGNTTNVILSGDPKQLGPVIRSPIALEFGLGKSLLERLMENPIYDEVKGLGQTIVKLTQNFRSHGAILRFPNEQFYKSELTVCGPLQTINYFVDSSLLVNKKFPVVFHAIPGQDMQESRSPSFFNIDEVTAVKDYINQLKNVGTPDKDIGVVCPYRAQCQKIRLILKTFAPDIKVGSAEEFQGDERLVMIISTVRSSQNLLEYDYRFTLGFVSNPRRFNVAVTRAKALLLVVGNPDVLSIDPLWRGFMNYVYSNNAWRGVPPSWDTNAPVDQDGSTYATQRREEGQSDMDNLTARLQSMSFDEPAGETPDVDNSE